MIRFGIVGAGVIAHQFAQDIRKCKDSKLVAIASRSIEKAEEFKDKYNLDYAYGSYEEMAKSNRIDAVYIATPHNFHKEQSILFMNSKIHVLCEKPISVNLRELNEMIDSAIGNKVLLMEAMWTRFLPATITVKEVVDSNTLGKLKKINLEFGYDLIDDYPEEKRLLNPALAGGSLLDLGVYPISYLMHMQKDTIKYIKASSRIHKTGVDIETNMDIEFNDGSLATLTSCMDTDMNKPGILEFENGIIKVEDFSRSKRIFINGEPFDIPFIKGGFSYQINSFVNTLNNNLLENEIMTYNESRKVMKIMDQVRNTVGVKYPFE
ncbi:MAG: Gfo/Idh/MocA family oxidoreductase [Candidatus Izimaplasma sp.]|nr:Gfo/Idh/MocA family oxidoreductase [Candidatus Izimaplasma bacterium]